MINDETVNMVFTMGETPESALAKAEAGLASTPPRGEPAMTLDEVLANMREFVERKVERLDPDDDVFAMAHIEGDTKTVLSVQPFDGDEAQEQVYKVNMPAMVRAARARVAVIVQPVWVAAEDAMVEGMRPHDAPTRTEGIVVFGSDGSRYVEFFADVTRREGEHPLLGEWTQAKDVPAIEAKWLLRPSVETLLATRMARAMRLWLMMQPADWWTPEREQAFDALDAGAGDPNNTAVQQAFLTLYGISPEFGVPEHFYELADREDFWSIPEPDCDTPAACLRIEDD